MPVNENTVTLAQTNFITKLLKSLVINILTKNFVSQEKRLQIILALGE